MSALRCPAPAKGGRTDRTSGPAALHMRFARQVYGLLEDLSARRVTEPGLTLTGDLALDSLRMVMLLVGLEERFGFELAEADINPFALKTAGDVVRLAAGYLAGKGGGRSA